MDTGPTAVMVGGLVRLNDAPASNAMVVVVDRAGASVTTGADGRFAFSLPIGSTQLLRVSHGTARSFQSMLVVPSRDLLSFNLEVVPSADIAMIYSGLGLTEDATRGLLLLHFHASGTQPAGFGATLSVGGGTRFVVPDSGPVRQETTAAGDDVLGVANVPAGVVTVTPIAPSGRICTPTYGVMTIRIDARTITDLSFDCR